MNAAEAVLAAALLDAERLRAELEATSRERDHLEAELRGASWSSGALTSGYTDELIREHGLLRLGRDFLQKPFMVDALARKVRELLDAA